jgi:hypothetical protein
MKTNYNLLKTLIVSALFTAASYGQTTLVAWNFNGTSNTTVAGGVAAPTPSIGTGSAALVGGTTATFANGNSTTGTMETETTNPPNYAWNTSGYPAPGTGNETAGVQFNVSTVGYSGIIFRMEQRLSNTANNTYVVQYTTDNTVATPVWVDAQTFTVTPTPTAGDTWYNARIVDLSGITGLDNNPNVAFRVVSAYDPTSGNYLATDSTKTYVGGTSGTVRYDSVYITANTQLGVSQYTLANAFTISPNPSRHQVVNFNMAQDIQVYDALGKMLLNAKDASSIDTASFTPGIYFVRTATGITKKLVVE